MKNSRGWVDFAHLQVVCEAEDLAQKRLPACALDSHPCLPPFHEATTATSLPYRHACLRTLPQTAWIRALSSQLKGEFKHCREGPSVVGWCVALRAASNFLSDQAV